jgi:hypothetical protein
MLAPVCASSVSKVTTSFFFYNCEYMMTKAQVGESEPRSVAETIRRAAKNKALARRRHKLAHFAAQTFKNVGIDLHAFGHIVGSDRARGVSPYGHGSDEAVAVSVLLRIASQLVSATADLFLDGRGYAAAALVRQIVEVEYLAWAIETRDRDGERWLRSDRRQRESFFTPRKLRGAAQGKFRSKDYGYHCELGGHPVPEATVLLDDDVVMPQLVLADLLGHTGRIWDHFVGWANHSSYGLPILSVGPEMSKRFSLWKSLDPLAAIPPPA